MSNDIYEKEPQGNKEELTNYKKDFEKVDADNEIDKKYGRFYNDIYYPLERILNYFKNNSIEGPILAMEPMEVTVFLKRHRDKIILEVVKTIDGRNYILRVLDHMLRMFDKQYERTHHKIRFNFEKTIRQWLYTYSNFHFYPDPKILQITQQLEYIHEKLCTLEQRFFTYKTSS